MWCIVGMYCIILLAATFWWWDKVALQFGYFTANTVSQTKLNMEYIEFAQESFYPSSQNTIYPTLCRFDQYSRLPRWNYCDLIRKIYSKLKFLDYQHYHLWSVDIIEVVARQSRRYLFFPTLNEAYRTQPHLNPSLTVPLESSPSPTLPPPDGFIHRHHLHARYCLPWVLQSCPYCSSWSFYMSESKHFEML